MAGKGPPGNPVPVSDLAGRILDPVLRRRAGISVGLVQSWDEIVGPALAAVTRPEKIQWPRRRGEDEPWEPAVLVIACEGAAALRVQHQTAEIVGRVNAFLGFAAVGRVRILQKPVGVAAAPKPPAVTLSREEDARLASGTAGIEDDALRASLMRLGASVLASRKRRVLPKS